MKVSGSVKGWVLEGSVDKGVSIVLKDEELIENYPLGALVKIRGSKYEFLGLITNAHIRSSQNGLDFISRRDISQTLKNLIFKNDPSMLRTQMIDVALVSKRDLETGEQSRADVIPSFNSPLVELSQEDVMDFYGVTDTEYVLGSPKSAQELEVGIPINIDKLVDLSFAIYGKSGSGKTFLGNILAGYIVLYDNKLDKRVEKGVKLLIFDMHSEYGLELRDNRGRVLANGVGLIFKDLFNRYTPDLKLAKERNLNPLWINVKDIQPEDIQLIAPIFGLSNTFTMHIYTFKKILSRKLGDYWFLGFFEGDQLKDALESTEEGKIILRELERELGGTSLEDLKKTVIKEIDRAEGYQVAQSFRTQTSKLVRLLKYPMSIRDDTIDIIVEKLLTEETGNVIISMGKYEKEMPLYMIIANLIARRLRKKILEMEEGGKEIKNKVIIFLEEAHNFLGKSTYNLSPFGDIAREMRKKGVTLCIIDQKPGELDPNVVSMIWTSFVFSLTDRRDIDQAVLGVDKADLFKKIVPTLSPREVLAFGEAVKYPVVVEVEDYKKVEEKFKSIADNIRNIDAEIEADLDEGGFL